MKFWKKFGCTVLVASLLALTVSACGEKGEGENMNEENSYQYDAEDVWNDVARKTEMIPADEETMIAAMQATALAYYHKNPYCQYDESHMTKEGYVKSVRNTWDNGPEFGSADQSYYAVCNTYLAAILLDAFNYKLVRPDGLPYFTKQFNTLTGPQQVYISEENTEADFDRIIREVKEVIKPGDFLEAYGDTGHVLLNLGDIYGDGKNYYTHCWGVNIQEDGTDKREENGAIYLQPEEEVVFGPELGSPNWGLNRMSHASYHVVVLRPLSIPDLTHAITPSAESRLKYPDMVIDKTASVSKYNTVVTGDKMEITVSVKNLGTEDYKGLEIEENVPVGTTLVSGETKATVDIPAGGSYELKFTVEVTALPGEKVLSAMGRVDNIPTRRMAYQVASSALTEEQVKSLKDLADKVVSEEITGETTFAKVNALYKELTGKDVKLPESVQAYLDLCFEERTGDNGKYLAPKAKTEENRYAMAMNPEGMFGGKYRLANGNVQDRMLDVMDGYFMPGDILVRLDGDNDIAVNTELNALVYVYLGDGKALKVSSKKSKVESLQKATFGIYLSNQFFVLRPPLVAKF